MGQADAGGCLESFSDVSCLALGAGHAPAQSESRSLATLDADVLEAHDVVWWHRDTTLDEATRRELDAVEDPLLDFVSDGGGLVLTHGAVEAASALGIEAHDPDTVGERTGGKTGFLVNRAFAEHPIFDGIDALRTEPAPVSDAVAVHYESLYPDDADVLAARHTDGTDEPAPKSILTWQVGDGRVVGVGHGLEAIETSHQSTLLDNVLSFAAGVGREHPACGRPKGPAEFQALRDTVPDSNHRPGYHFTPPANWLNDPNGVVQWGGRYHLFYQYNPAGPFHDSIHWGHAVSDDLVHWEDEPIALSPDPDGPDSVGCWSGCFVDDEGSPAVLYTGGSGDEQLPCLARATDDTLTTWEKSDANPVIGAVPADPDILSSVDWRAEFRDHCVWRTDGTWYQLIGSGIGGEGGAALLFESENLDDWEYCHPILVGDWRKSGPMWECPELLRFETGALLHVSDYSTVQYFVGDYDDESNRLTPTNDGRLDYGVFYAPQSFDTDDGRTLMFGWLREDRSQAAQWDAGWSGAMSLPRVVSLDDDGTLDVSLPDELTDLRETHHSFDGLTVAGGERDGLPAVDGTMLEIQATVDAEHTGEFGVVLRATPDDEERTVVRCDVRHREIRVDRSATSLSDEANDAPHSMPITLDDGKLSFRLFLDRSVLELFANDAQALTTRLYPTREDSTGVSLYANDADVTFESLDIWELSP